MSMKMNLLGQYFTPNWVVNQMLALRQNKGTILEPSAGDGAFMKHLEESAVGIEIDRTLTKDSRVIIKDFFNYSVKNKFDTIIGNPPYVRYRDISKATLKKLPMDLFDKRTNLFLFFMSKCIHHLEENGELILIVPREFLKLTSAKKLNEKMYQLGSMTHYYELGDQPIFEEATPNCAIFRWQKGLKNRTMTTDGYYQVRNGQVLFTKSKSKTKTIGDYFDVKVGAVSGADAIFQNDARGCTDMVCSTTFKDGKTRRMIYQRKDESLIPYKEKLINRKIKSFNNDNWWEWGRKYFEKDGERIYVNGKTRNTKPFYISDVKAYDGSVLALFPKNGIDLSHAVECLNKANWGGVWFCLRWAVFIYPKKSSKRTNYILMIPQSLLNVASHLRQTGMTLMSGGGDGRIDSAQSENRVVQYIQNANRWRVEFPNLANNNRSWYDVKIESLYVNIKISKCQNKYDNVSAKSAIYYFLTGIDNQIPQHQFEYFRDMRDHENSCEIRDFYYLIVNKTDLSDVFIVSLKGISDITVNPSNPPFQAKWINCREYIQRDWNCAKNFLLEAYAGSIQKTIDLARGGMLTFYPQFFQ